MLSLLLDILSAVICSQYGTICCWERPAIDMMFVRNGRGDGLMNLAEINQASIFTGKLRQDKRKK
jgi:hypothetical protein